MTNAMSFVRTILSYHGEHESGTPLPEATGNHLISDGYFSGGVDEPFLRITPEKRDGEEYFKLAVNAHYAHMSEGALAMRIIYEMNRFFSERDNSYDLEAKTRGMLLAFEWLKYMTFPGESRRDTLVKGLAETYGWPIGGDGPTMSNELLEKTDATYGGTQWADRLLTEARHKAWDGLDIR